MDYIGGIMGLYRGSKFEILPGVWEGLKALARSRVRLEDARGLEPFCAHSLARPEMKPI